MPARNKANIEDLLDERRYQLMVHSFEVILCDTFPMPTALSIATC